MNWWLSPRLITLYGWRETTWRLQSESDPGGLFCAVLVLRSCSLGSEAPVLNQKTGYREDPYPGALPPFRDILSSPLPFFVIWGIASPHTGAVAWPGTMQHPDWRCQLSKKIQVYGQVNINHD
jgi:hypothetical protein